MSRAQFSNLGLLTLPYLFIRRDLSCVWKLLGDCMTMIHSLDDGKVILTISDLLHDEKSSENKVSKIQVSYSLFRLFCA